MDPFIIKKPHVTEKSTDLNADGKYVFIVKPNATKPEIRKALKEIYKVNPVAVRVVNLPPKTRRFRGLRGKVGGVVRKAIVTLAPGEKIDLGR